ncbi:hypothetical protein CA85_07210 [Allorhodopirellula solitaria]|uniref:DUF58 domain-containing protein n=2 Tax=Allorhodopirellula solitaria TaxID=2527987 RepID=A0A5C5YKJ2_9BACT|nr:hypothetical protein CA85_07210 [Allorhodopirellula solitaria]
MLIGAFGLLGGSLKGLNLLVVVAAVTLGALFVQWRISLMMIEGLRVDRRMPPEGFAGKPMRIRYQLHNSHRLMPVWLIQLEDTLQRTEVANSTHHRTSRPTGVLQRTMTGVGLLMPGRSTSAYFDITTAHRGRYRWNHWLISTTAPLALSTASRELDGSSDFVDVYPRLLRLSRSWDRILPSKVGSLSAAVHRHGHADDEFFGLREYRHGDSPRHIHWRTTARLVEPAVRQFEQQQRFDLCLLVDAWSDRFSSAGPSEATAPQPTVDETVETAISLAATIAMDLTEGGENRVLLVVAGEELDIVRGGPSVIARKRMLQCLANVVACPDVAMSEALTRAASAAERMPDLVVISPRSQSDAVAADEVTAATLRHWNTRSQVNWIDISNREQHDWFTLGDD